MSGPKLATASTALNPNVHDYELDDSGQPVWLDGDISDLPNYAAEIAQALKTRWLMMLGEWYLDQRQGTPWTQVLLSKGVTVESIKRVFRGVALSTPGIRTVESLGVVIDGAAREATITYQLRLESNVVVTTEQLDAPFILDIPPTETS